MGRRCINCGRDVYYSNKRASAPVGGGGSGQAIGWVHTHPGAWILCPKQAQPERDAGERRVVSG